MRLSRETSSGRRDQYDTMASSATTVSQPKLRPDFWSQVTCTADLMLDSEEEEQLGPAQLQEHTSATESHLPNRRQAVARASPGCNGIPRRRENELGIRSRTCRRLQRPSKAFSTKLPKPSKHHKTKITRTATMRLQRSAAILAILPLAIGDLFKDMLSTSNSNMLESRAAEPANIVSLAPSIDQPWFQVTGFDAFMPSAAAANNPETSFSRAVFNLRLMHPDPTKRWTTRCFV